MCQSKAKFLTSMLKKDEVPLRPHVREVMADAVADTMHVAFIAGTQSDTTDEVVASALRQLGPHTGSQVKVFNCNKTAGEELAAAQDHLKGFEKGFENAVEPNMSNALMSESLKHAAMQEKQRSACAFVQSLQENGSGESPTPITLDASLVASNRRIVSAEFLAALAAALGVRMANCLLLASSLGVAQAGCTAGMLTIAIPRKMALQGSFPGVAAKMDGYGTGAATWPRLRSLLGSNVQQS